MRAAVVERYGGPELVRVAEVSTPRPGPRQVLVRVRAVAVTSGDARIRAARFPPGFAVPARLAFGLRRPRRPILGSACSGVVEAVGSEVDGLTPGDEVCGMVGARMGAHAELVVAAADRMVPKPAAVTHDDAAGVLFGGTTARWFLHENAAVAAGSTVLVNGASGAVGTNAVQLARRAGATVTGVCSGANATLVTGLGAHRVIDHTTVDLATVAERFDVVFDAVGNLTAASGRRLLNPGGVLLLAVAGLGDLLRARGPVVAGSGPERAVDFAALVALVAAGDLRVVIDEVFDLDHVVDAHRRVDTGHKVGNVLLHPGT